MPDKILAYDLGTGGNKASLYDAEGRCLASVFVAYETEYPQAGWHEQRPAAWWDSVVQSTRQLLAAGAADPRSIACLAISGHSLGCVPLAADGRLLRQATPIWSDKRPVAQAAGFFRRIDEARWYRLTGNGFPPPHYTVFKILWYRDHEPEMFRAIHKIVGTKDYINYKLTGRMATDYSYASGSGVYDLLAWDYCDELLAAAELPRSLLPEIVPSQQVLGPLTAEAAEQLGLPREVQVACGGVDNSCMALGARNVAEGRVYASLGSSSWIAVSSSRPLLDETARPYVFTHVVPGMFTSAVAIFSSGTSLKWVRDQLLRQSGRRGPRPRQRPLRRDDRAGRAIARRRQGTVVQPQSGRRLVAGCQCEHPRGLVGPRSAPHPGRRHPRDLGGDRPEPSAGARRVAAAGPGGQRDGGRGRGQPQQALAADLRRRLGDRHSQDEHRPGGGLPGRGGRGGGGGGTVGRFQPHRPRFTSFRTVPCPARSTCGSTASSCLFRQAALDQSRLGDLLAGVGA